MKTWEVYKVLDEWDTVSKSPLFKNLENEQIYKFVYDGQRKGLKINDELYRHKTKYDFSLNCKWKEVTYKFNIGDIVIDTKNNKIHTITDQLNNGRYKGDKFFNLNEDNLKLATEEDINLDEKRKKWAKLNRKINEYKVGDIIKYPCGVGTVATVKENSVVILESIFNYYIDTITLICPVESRID